MVQPVTALILQGSVGGTIDADAATNALRALRSGDADDEAAAARHHALFELSKLHFQGITDGGSELLRRAASVRGHLSMKLLCEAHSLLCL